MPSNWDEVQTNYMLEKIAERGRDLTKWEEDFILSINEMVNEGRKLTEKQYDVLRRIFTEKAF